MKTIYLIAKECQDYIEQLEKLLTDLYRSIKLNIQQSLQVSKKVWICMTTTE